MAGIDVERIARFGVGSGDSRVSAIDGSACKVRACAGRQRDGVAGHVAFGGGAAAIENIAAVNVAVDGGVVRDGHKIADGFSFIPDITAGNILLNRCTT